MGNRGNRGAKEALVAERRAKVLQMRAAGVPPAVIAQQLGITTHQVSNDLQRSLKLRTEEMNQAAGELRALEVEKLEAMERAAWAVMHRKHYQIGSSGQVARHPETKEVLTDDDPILRSIATLLRIQERRSKLLGLDAPTRSSLEVKSVDQSTINAEIARVFSELVTGGSRPVDGYPEVQPLAIEGPSGPAATGGPVEDGVS
jgi:DNA-binding CsgD family transcriptional regulator